MNKKINTAPYRIILKWIILLVEWLGNINHFESRVITKQKLKLVIDGELLVNVFQPWINKSLTF